MEDDYVVHCWKFGFLYVFVVIAGVFAVGVSVFVFLFTLEGVFMVVSFVLQVLLVVAALCLLFKEASKGIIIGVGSLFPVVTARQQSSRAALQRANRLQNSVVSNSLNDHSVGNIDIGSRCCSSFGVERVFVGTTDVRSVEDTITHSQECQKGDMYMNFRVTKYYQDLGDCDRVCEYCNALFWFDERIKVYSARRHLRYHKCCMDGRVVLPIDRHVPLEFKRLLESAHFMDNIRAYNQMFSMTSYGAKIDDSVNSRRGPYVFKISGQVYHWMGSLYPLEDSMPRMSHFGGQEDSSLDVTVVRKLIAILDTHNQIKLFSVTGSRQYELPTSDAVGAIVYGENVRSERDYDVIVELRSGTPQRINKLHQLYMSLQFPLLFMYGQMSYHPGLDLRETGRSIRGRSKQMTMNMYYSYQIRDRAGTDNLLTRSGRLFQQYIVTAYCSIELQRIDYKRNNQNNIRNEYLCGLHDAINREIRRYLAAFSHLTTADRADIVTRIFELKVNKFVNYLKQEWPFGRVVAVLYTIEFQKRGTPHCHTLLWTETLTLSLCNIDDYILAELPDPTVDPLCYKVVSEFMIHGPCGAINVSATCMDRFVCTKKFTKSLNMNTYFDKNGYAQYRRRNTGVTTKKCGVDLDNSYVVPYNSNLCLIFHAHINVKYCGWTMLIKYLFKYISKGTDRIVMRVSRDIGQRQAETENQPRRVDEI
ncbi:uncharacterized protein [Rutidosis leptorrhynchoides]|uniref:uncharacterized protein n=1 Tax=Rutidosis leptorrhynchoides TaxID=125765 RepID=UPI003A991C38